MLRKCDPKRVINREEFTEIFSKELVFIEKLIQGEIAIPEFDSFVRQIEIIYDQVKKSKDGTVATYIPQLATVDPDKLAVSICTIDGQVFHIGDTDDLFCLQSSCKPLNYCLAVEENGLDWVHRHVGHEPSGKSFNEISLTKKGLPHNPLVNSGAIMVCSLIKAKMPNADRFEHVLSTWKRACSSSRIGFNESVYLSERETADRNFALAYFMRENGAFPPETEIEKTLEFYFQCCSIESSTKDLARFAAMLASGGICPFSNEKIFTSSTVKNCLSIMNSCGMYDYSGEFSFEVGVPAKSGVSGAVYAVVPNTMGICVWSPRINEQGNSVRALDFFRKLNEKFLLHNYDSLVLEDQGKTNPRVNSDSHRAHQNQDLCYAAASGDVKQLQTLLARGAEVNYADYDQRTALHLAVCEQQLEAVAYLLAHGADRNYRDRWGRTAVDEAVALKDEKMLEVFKKVRVLPPGVTN